MAAAPKRRRIRAALQARAQRRMGTNATGLDYVRAWVASGGQIAHLALSLEVELRESVSRSILSLTVHRLSPTASGELYAARAEGTSHLVRHNLPTVDVRPPSREQVDAARVLIRLNALRSVQSRAEGGARVTAPGHGDTGRLHLAALRERRGRIHASRLRLDTTSTRS